MMLPCASYVCSVVADGMYAWTGMKWDRIGWAGHGMGRDGLVWYGTRMYVRLQCIMILYIYIYIHIYIYTHIHTYIHMCILYIYIHIEREREMY